ncbi:MAG TPA: hypothetical protein VND93_23260, partial [Myxococcales bacterium]|nr:hypothetical protein [Myxococcales bacterium]
MAGEDEDQDDGEGLEEPSGHGDVPLRRARELLERLGATPHDPGIFGVNWAAAMQFAAAAPADDGDDGWTPIGPRNVGGAVRSLAQDPVNGATFYAGTAGGGLWRTTDDGHTWQPLGEADIGVVPVGAVAVAPNDPQV